MKVLNELSVKDLRLNKKRSIVIIIGIILSTALICGVAGLVTSFQKTFIETAKAGKGNYHTIFYNVPKDELKYIEENRGVPCGGRPVFRFRRLPERRPLLFLPDGGWPPRGRP